jgi:hypothetical protein
VRFAECHSKAVGRVSLFRTRCVVILIAVASLSACSLETDVSEPAVVQIIQGDAQTVATNTMLPIDLGVVVVTQLGEPVADETVQWSVVSGGGTVTPLTSQTNEHGVATTSYTAGATAGDVKVTAQTGGLRVTFDVTVT